MRMVGKRATLRWWTAVLVLSLLSAGGAVGLWAWWWRGDGLLLRGRAAYAQGNWQGTKSFARQRIKTAPNDVEAWQLLARASARLGGDALAQSIYGSRMTPAQMQGEDYYLLGAGLFRQEQTAAAISVLEKGIRIDPRHPELLQELSRSYAHRDDLIRATDLAARLASVPGWEARGDLLAGVLKYEQTDSAGAAKHLERALKHDPALRGAVAAPALARKLLARAWLRLGQHAAARGPLETLLSEGSDPEAAWLLSRALLQSGDGAGAAAALARSQEYGDESVFAHEPAPYVGAAKCAECHLAIHSSQQHSLHARTFYPTSGLDAVALPQQPVADRFDPAVVHTLKREGNRIGVATRVGDRTYRALVDYAIGSGDRGLTLVGRDDAGQSRELRLSRYSDGSGWDVTIGQRPNPQDPAGYLGLPLSVDEVHGCVHCHTTDGRAMLERVGPTVADRGIGCERCHGPGGNHVQAVAVKFPDLAIARPQSFSAERQVRLCAQCHTPKGNVVINPMDKTTVRFQAVHFVKSRCYTESNGALSCLTCHNPHRDAETSAVFYESKCLSCHAAGPTKGAKDGGHRPVSCPVNPTNGCLPCHMPVEKQAIPHATFSDHHIRVHQGSAD